MNTQILTIGHSAHGVDGFVALLHRHAVSAVADVRSQPFSRYAPHFNRNAPQKTLAASGIGYVFLGKELGARSQDRSCYVNGQVQYERIARTGTFLTGIDRLLAGAEAERVAVMCTEKDPLDCHRTLLVALALADRGAEVSHILADGRLETNDEAMSRLLRRHGLDQPDLFRSSDELLEEALMTQEQRIAYVDQDLAATITDRN